MSTKVLAHKVPGAPIGHLMSTQCGAHKCSQRKQGLMSTGVAHECSRKKNSFGDATPSRVMNPQTITFPPPCLTTGLESEGLGVCAAPFGKNPCPPKTSLLGFVRKKWALATLVHTKIKLSQATTDCISTNMREIVSLYVRCSSRELPSNQKSSPTTIRVRELPRATSTMPNFENVLAIEVASPEFANSSVMDTTKFFSHSPVAKTQILENKQTCTLRGLVRHKQRGKFKVRGGLQVTWRILYAWQFLHWVSSAGFESTSRQLPVIRTNNLAFQALIVSQACLSSAEKIGVACNIRAAGSRHLTRGRSSSEVKGWIRSGGCVASEAVKHDLKADEH
ncbi:hypothetical protein BDV93DRAFT_515264 [Ceratobasidium sp. AG-I]|nr:hypothetical protein BDV93DRAFT_515264 [Ceratobasidium sp. AG-I]